MKKYVLTGGPCVGKTAVLNGLAKEGYKIVKEIAREVIKEQQSINGKLLPWINVDKFQRAVWEKQLEIENNVKSSIVFFDQAIPSGIPFYLMANLEPPKELIELSKDRYYKVFLLAPLQFYEKDSERKQDQKEAQKLHNLTKETYLKLGYQVIEVPLLPIKERVKFIKKHL